MKLFKTSIFFQNSKYSVFLNTASLLWRIIKIFLQRLQGVYKKLTGIQYRGLPVEWILFHPIFFNFLSF